MYPKCAARLVGGRSRPNARAEPRPGTCAESRPDEGALYIGLKKLAVIDLYSFIDGLFYRWALRRPAAGWRVVHDREPGFGIRIDVHERSKWSNGSAGCLKIENQAHSFVDGGEVLRRKTADTFRQV